MAGVVSLCFFLGVLYRPASLYHPQRRAILHLKSLQKRSRLKDQHLKNATQATQLQSSLASGGGPGVERGVTSTSKAAPSSGGQGGAGSSSSSEKPAYFDFAVLKSKTVQIILSGTCIAHFGMTAPIFLLVSIYITQYCTPYITLQYLFICDCDSFLEILGRFSLGLLMSVFTDCVIWPQIKQSKESRRWEDILMSLLFRKERTR